MQKFLPLFPLQLVVFPGERLKLHIFEPRYKQLIGECHHNTTTFGIPPYLDGELARYGTEMVVVEVYKTYESGEMDILTEGLHAFRVESFVKDLPEKLYSGGDVTILRNEEETSTALSLQLAALYNRFHELLRTGHARSQFQSANLSYQLGQEVGLNMTQKIDLLATTRESARQQLIVDHLQHVIPLLEAADETRKKVQGNGHFRKPEEK